MTLDNAQHQYHVTLSAIPVLLVNCLEESSPLQATYIQMMLKDSWPVTVGCACSVIDDLRKKYRNNDEQFHQYSTDTLAYIRCSKKRTSKHE